MRAEVLGCREGLSDFASTAQSDRVCGQILSGSEVRTHARTHEPVSIRLVILTMGFTHLSRRETVSDDVRAKDAHRGRKTRRAGLRTATRRLFELNCHHGGTGR